VFFIPGGVGTFYGLLHTTGNLQGNFAIFEQKLILLHAQDVHSPVLAKYSLNK